MSIRNKLYTVESVTLGHPDKVCDQVSDAILDACLAEDPMSRVAVETFGNHGEFNIGGEVTTNAKVDYAAIASRVYKEAGYEAPLSIHVHVVQQSPDIALGVDTGGAGDQGIMYGFATDETPEFLPRGIVLAHQLTEGLEKLRKEGVVKWLRPDGKSQVTMMDGKVQTILVSTQHTEDVSQEEIRQTMIDKLITPLVGDASKINIYINPTGRFVQGGFDSDTGLTGRKLMVDTYGGLIPHGGGCFSGKDPSKVDRSGAYMARFVAKNLVANGFAKECLVSVAYAIGKAEPLMVEALDEDGKSLRDIAMQYFDFRPRAIMDTLKLRQPIYGKTAKYGHFGKAGLPWEEIIKMKA